MPHRGSCHCGRIAFLVDGEIDAAISCNCSICARKGALLSAVEPERFKLLTAPEESATYAFRGQTITHRFCRTCGMQPYSESAGDGTLYVNLNCVETIDRAGLTIIPFDGRAL